METRSFGGIRALQTWADFLLWELVLNAHYELAGIAELGTAEGGFALYLHAQAQARRLEFRTYDRQAPPTGIPCFEELDVFANAGKVRAQLPSPGILFCDNGDKPREVALYAPLLRAGELLVVHDWSDEGKGHGAAEIGPADIPADLLRMVHEDICLELGADSRVFVRI